jgi:hypothetical protein
MPHRVWVASESLDVFENPFVVAALFVDVFEQRGLVAPIIGAATRCCEGQQRRCALHMVVGLAEKIQIKCPGSALAHDLLNQRDLDEFPTGTGGLTVGERGT